MVYFGAENDFGGRHRVVVGQQEFGVEVSPFVAGAFGTYVMNRVTLDDNEEVFVVVGVGSANDTGNGLVRESFRFLNDPRGWAVHVCF